MAVTVTRMSRTRAQPPLAAYRRAQDNARYCPTQRQRRPPPTQTADATATRVNKLMLNPLIYNINRVTINETGIVTNGLIEALKARKKRITTHITDAVPSKLALNALLIAARCMNGGRYKFQSSCRRAERA